jgi:hypothetical protein
VSELQRVGRLTISERAVKVPTCVDCVTTPLGEHLRCPRCRDAFRARLADRSVYHVLLTWLVGAEIVMSIALGFILVAKGC